MVLPLEPAERGYGGTRLTLGNHVALSDEVEEVRVHFDEALLGQHLLVSSDLHGLLDLIDEVRGLERRDHLQVKVPGSRLISES